MGGIESGLFEFVMELGVIDMGKGVGGDGDAVFVGDFGGKGGEDFEFGGVFGLDGFFEAG